VTAPRRRVPDGPHGRALAAALAAVRDELGVPTAIPPAVRAAAEEAVARGPRGEREDHRAIPLLTIDPPGSMDLDQALHVEPLPGATPAEGGIRVRYAIADVAAFVRDGDPVDVEAWDRGVTRYSPDLVTPLHPPELSEGAASLLPGQDRPAVLWTLDVDATGDLVATDVRRALVRSRRRLTYAEAQRAVDGGGDPVLVLLSRLGRLRAEREWVRGGVSLELPEQEVEVGDDGAVDLVLRAPLPVEGWNAQVSLLAGHAAALLMLDAGVGVLRTLPAPAEAQVAALRRRAWALGLPWPEEVGYAAFVRTLDPHEPVEAAMIAACASGLRGAGYAAFDVAAGLPVPEVHRHEALAMPYAHVTAPLRRLVDRFAAEVCLAVAAGRPVPAEVLERLPALPDAMARARSRAAALERAVVDLVEAHLLADRVGDVLAGTVLRADGRGSDVQLRAPAVTARVPDALAPGEEVRLRVAAVDLSTRSVTYAVV
jgi:exoribonuclease R